MPTLLNQEGFKFFFYANEHDPKHIHVLNANGYAKIELGSLTVVKSTFKNATLHKVLNLVRKHNDEFERKWNEFFNR